MKYKSIWLIIQNEENPLEIILTKRWTENPEFWGKESYPGILQKTIAWTIENKEAPNETLKKEIFEEIEEILRWTEISRKNKKTIYSYIDGQTKFWEKLYKVGKHLTITHKVNKEIFDLLKKLEFTNKKNTSLKIIDLNKVNSSNFHKVTKELREKWVEDYEEKLYLFPDDIKLLKKVKNYEKNK